MVGVIVVGVIGAAIAATVFAVIPWSQDNAAKASLSAVRTAESVAFTQSTETGRGAYLNSENLSSSNLISMSPTVVVGVNADASCYVAAALSGSGKVFLLSDAGPETVVHGDGADLGCVRNVDALVSKLFPDLSNILALTIDTSLPNCQAFTLPIQQDRNSTNPVKTNVTVDWGDGSEPQTSTLHLPTHSYAAAGPHALTVTGTFDQLGTTLNPTGSTSCITSLERWGEGTQSTSAGYAFYGAPVTSVVRPPSTITTMTGMFRDTKVFNGDLNSWDMSRITNIAAMFNGATTFNGDLSNWDTGSVVNLNQTFYNAKAFNGDVSDWDTRNAVSTARTFMGATTFAGDVSDWDMRRVTNMSSMFQTAVAFNGNLSSWNVSAVTDMSSLFQDATAFKGDLSQWNTSNVVNMSNMFWNTAGSDVSRWDTSNVVNMSGMFWISRFNGDISEWDTSSVTNMYQMFNHAYYFNGDISRWNTSKVTNMSWMFANTSSFDSDVSNWDTRNATQMKYMFQRAAAFEGDLSRWDTSKAVEMSGMFSGAKKFNSDVSNWNTGNVTQMTGMFERALLFNNGGRPLLESAGGWSVAGVTSAARMAYMFNETPAFTQDLSSWRPQFVGVPQSFGITDGRAPVWTAGN